MSSFFGRLKMKIKWRKQRREMMRQYRKDYVPPYTVSEEPPEEVLNSIMPKQEAASGEEPKEPADEG